jgi:hypothetical protein
MRRAVALAAVLLLAPGCGAVREAIDPQPPTTLPGPGGTVVDPSAVTAATTTSEPPPVADTSPTLTAAAGDLVVDALRLGEGGLGRARFGTDADEAEAYVRSVLGPPDEDTDWGLAAENAFGVCPGNLARALRWGQLLVVLTDDSRYGAGRGHLSGWVYGPSVAPDAFYPEGLTMATGVAPGVALEAVQLVFPGGVTVVEPDAVLPARFRVGTSFGGWLTGTTPADTVTSLEAGEVCSPAPATSAPTTPTSAPAP